MISTPSIPPPLLHTTSSSAFSYHSNGSTNSLSQYPRADQGEEVTVEGLVHSEIVLEARRHRTPEFAEKLVRLLRDHLAVKSWANHPSLAASDLKIYKVSGSLTNAIFFISAPSVQPQPHQVLLRIYGPSSGSLISRPKELYTLHNLSSKYRIGPRVFGTFGNGRVEEYFDSKALTEEDMKNPQISRWIGRRMAELHSVDIDEVMLSSDGWKGKGLVSAKKNLKKWFPLAQEVIKSLNASSLPMDHPWRSLVKSIDLERLQNEGKAYWKWIELFEAQYGEGERVFAHNDAQYGNLLRLTTPPKNKPSHHQIIVVDFEYAAPNPAAFDIANHFHEWTTNYNSETNAHVLEPSRYPTIEQRKNFYHAYLSPLPTGPYSSDNLLASASTDSLLSLSSNNYVSADTTVVEEDIARLERQVRAWSPASHAMWTVWAIVQARDDVEAGHESGEFNYLGYALNRVEAFRREIKQLGVEVN
ncbi:hypothetical protein FRC03_002027 [Tulasnella sp. 419]|nr:hypothetical protein FRC02_003312 [Tulasnella sp. 418]KAG8964260.1 hypothetical protein FRC03_002027 [Tulasnella sp. 419]